MFDKLPQDTCCGCWPAFVLFKLNQNPLVSLTYPESTKLFFCQQNFQPFPNTTEQLCEFFSSPQVNLLCLKDIFFLAENDQQSEDKDQILNWLLSNMQNLSFLAYCLVVLMRNEGISMVSWEQNALGKCWNYFRGEENRLALGNTCFSTLKESSATEISPQQSHSKSEVELGPLPLTASDGQGESEEKEQSKLTNSQGRSTFVDWCSGNWCLLCRFTCVELQKCLSVAFITYC